jgi:hypothetical protein
MNGMYRRGMMCTGKNEMCTEWDLQKGKGCVQERVLYRRGFCTGEGFIQEMGVCRGRCVRGMAIRGG